MKTVFIVLAEEDGSFIGVFANESDAEKKAAKYQEQYGDVCEVFEEELE